MKKLQIEAEEARRLEIERNGVEYHRQARNKTAVADRIIKTNIMEVVVATQP